VKVLLVDFYDSFTFNVVHYLENLGCKVDIVRNDKLDFNSIQFYNGIILSPGPGLPSEKENLFRIISAYQGKIPILGVCLGMQAIGIHLGGILKNQNFVKHGKEGILSVVKQGALLQTVNNGMKIGLYHSWSINDLNEKYVLGYSSEGVIMAIECLDKKLFGVQFHPESILTENGIVIFKNFINQL
jgi:anthranilate synthase component 2